MSLFKWAELHTNSYPELALLFAIPNGGDRHPVVAARLKAEGVRRGVPDICLPVARGVHHGLYIELKTATGKASKAQREWLRALTVQGYCAVICHGWTTARQLIENYLAGILPADLAHHSADAARQAFSDPQTEKRQ